MRCRSIVALAIVFGIGVFVGRGFGPSAIVTAQTSEPSNPYAEMLHVGIVVKDLDQAVARWRAPSSSGL